MVISMYIAQVWGHMIPWGSIFFRIINIQSYCPFPCSTLAINASLLSFVEINSPVPEKKIFEGFLPYNYGYGGHLGHVTWIIYIHIGLKSPSYRCLI